MTATPLINFDETPSQDELDWQEKIDRALSLSDSLGIPFDHIMGEILAYDNDF